MSFQQMSAAPNGAGSMGGGGMAMPGQGQVMMSEDAYIQHCQQFASTKGHAAECRPGERKA